MKVEIWFDRSNAPLVFGNVYADYQKGDLFCVGWVDPDGFKYVNKYPLDHIFTIRESNFETSQPSKE